jgi:hypothetical protein
MEREGMREVNSRELLNAQGKCDEDLLSAAVAKIYALCIASDDPRL